MTTEPTYVFDPQHGWIPEVRKVGYITCSRGKKWRVTEMKTPEVGMIWDGTNYKNGHYAGLSKDFNHYLKMRNSSADPATWSKWEKHLAVVYDVYFKYEQIT